MERRELTHYGVLGMKWGVRRSDAQLAKARILRGHAGHGIYIGSDKRKLTGYKKNLETLDKGGHLSIGLTKKRQEDYDKRDREVLNKKISQLEKKISSKSSEIKRKEVIDKTDGWSSDAKKAQELKKNVKQLSNEELKLLNKRVQLEQEYARLNPSTVSKGRKYVGAAVAALGTTVGAYNNLSTLIKIGKKLVKA